MAFSNAVFVKSERVISRVIDLTRVLLYIMVSD